MTGVRERIVAVMTNVSAPQAEWPSVVRPRKLLVIAVLVVGAVLLGLSLTRRPGDTSFYWLTFALAVVWGGWRVPVRPTAFGQHLLAWPQRRPAPGAHRGEHRTAARRRVRAGRR